MARPPGAQVTGLLADYVTVECRCGAVLMVPARMATGIDAALCWSCTAEQTDAEARAAAEKVKRGTDKTTNSKGRDGR